MTEPGGASEVGAIIGYLRLNREDWVRGVRESERDSDRLGRLNPSIRITTNAGDVIGQLALVRAAERGIGTEADKAKPFVVNLWAALAAVAPAAVPIAAVAGGALIGLVPVLATVALGVSGVKAEMKSGALEGTEYGRMLDSLESDAKKLQTTAAQGLLSGLDRGLAASSGLIPTITEDIGDMSTQIGDIIAGGMPALLRILTQLNPLFITFGNLLTRGATELENWSQHSTGVSSFVAYVQAELPQVMAFLGNLVVLFSHIAQAAAPFGGVLLTDLTLLVRVLNAIPVGVLQNAIPVVVSLYVALKAYQGVNAILAGISKAVQSMTTPFAASAASANASSLAVQAAAAEEAAGVARAKAAEAQATAEASIEIAASVEGTSSVLAGGATAAAEAAVEFAAAMEAEAEAATAAAAEIGLAATAAAETVAAEGATASAGWSAMLGPLAAVGIGLTFLLTAFTGSSSKAQEAAKIQDSYADSLRKTTDALADVNIQTTNKNLSEDNALANLDALTKSNSGLKLSYSDLALAVNGSQAQFDKVRDSLMAVAGANKNVIDTSDGYATRGPVPQYNATGTAAVNLLNKIKGLREGLDAQTKTQLALNEANREAQQLQDGGASAADATARSLGVTKQAYLDAQVAAKKNTDQTNQQALAFRLANDGGSLLALTLDKLSGKKLNYQQALNAFETQLTSGGPRSTPGTPGTPGTVDRTAVSAAQTRRKLAIEALTVAQNRYNDAVAKGNAHSIASAQLSLDRAKAAVTNATNAVTKAQQGTGGTKGTPGTAADTRVTGGSAAAVQNRSDILAGIQAAEQAAEQFGKQTGSTEQARAKLVELRKEFINSRVALGENRKDVTAYVDSILTIPPAVAQADKTALDLKTDAAKKKLADFNAHLAELRKGVKVPITVTDPSALLLTIQKHIDSIHGKKVVIDAISTVAGGGFNVTGGAGVQARAGGGTVYGPGGPKSDSVLLRASAGEEVIQMPYAAQYRSLLKQINTGKVPLLALRSRGVASAPASEPTSRGGTPPLHAGNVAEALHGMRIVIDAGSVGTLTGFVDSRVDGTLGRASRTPSARQSRADEFGRA